VTAEAKDDGHKVSDEELFQTARGEYHALVNQADVVHPNLFLAQVEYLEANSTFEVVPAEFEATLDRVAVASSATAPPLLYRTHGDHFDVAAEGK
jgi:hypothetical protein